MCWLVGSSCHTLPRCAVRSAQCAASDGVSWGAVAHPPVLQWGCLLGSRPAGCSAGCPLSVQHLFGEAVCPGYLPVLRPAVRVPGGWLLAAVRMWPYAVAWPSRRLPTAAGHLFGIIRIVKERCAHPNVHRAKLGTPPS